MENGNGKEQTQNLLYEFTLFTGIILPHTGVDPDYDQSCSAIDQCKHQLNKYLEQIKRELKCTVSIMNIFNSFMYALNHRRLNLLEQAV